MKILLIEDCREKIQAIKECIKANLNESPYDIVSATCLDTARRNIIGQAFDLIIFDMFLPVNADGGSESEEDISFEIIKEFSESKNYQAESIAITRYDVDEIDNRSLFNDSGVTVVQYSDDNKWKYALVNKLIRIKENIKYDFLIFCALQKERDGYVETSADVGERRNIKGLNCQELEIGGFKGLCITPKKVGLVHMAILATKAIEAFNPNIVAMSGICAGVKGESDMLDLVVGQLCWEYQTGKLKNNEFKQEPYQAPIEDSLETELDLFIEEDGLLEELKKGLYANELQTSRVFLAPISSGSAVIASESKMKEIVGQQRKMAALEMEMYSLYEAARQSLSKPLFFGAKAVVDLGNSKKGDDYHINASIISARFIVKFLEKKLPGFN